MIESKNVIKTIGEKIILRNINIQIDKGQTVAILGPNGVGKSTWLKIAAGLMQPTEGQILINGDVLKKDQFEQREMLGYLCHQSFLYNKLSHIEYIKYIA